MATVTPSITDTSALDSDRVVATLHRLGIRYIVAEPGAQPYGDAEVPPAQLIAAMLRDESARVEYAVIPLWLRYPELAPSALDLVRSLPPAEADLLRRHYTAAVYLQRYWRPALDLYLGEQPDLPDYFSAEMNLPAPELYFGEIGLRELASRLPPPIDWWETYLDPVRMFIRTLSLEKTYGWTTG